MLTSPASSGGNSVLQARSRGTPESNQALFDHIANIHQTVLPDPEGGFQTGQRTNSGSSKELQAGAAEFVPASTQVAQAAQAQAAAAMAAAAMTPLLHPVMDPISGAVTYVPLQQQTMLDGSTYFVPPPGTLP